MPNKKQLLAALLAASLLAAGGSPPPLVEPLPAPTRAWTAAAPTPSESPRLWVAPAAPESLRAAAEALGLEQSPSREAASLRLEPASSGALWVYAFVAAFPTVEDGVTLQQVQGAFEGEGPRLLMSASTLEAMKTLFDGEPGSGVEVVPSAGLTEALWQDSAARAIVPFEQISPKMKVLTLEGQSPLWKSFDPQAYPLKVFFAAEGLPLPLTNRDPQKLTTVLLTGVTALVRATAAKMETKGLLYPAEAVGAWLREADIAHLSNEVAFAEDCPPPDPYQQSLRFCSAPENIGLMEAVGVDVVELTGNHVLDWGAPALLDTLAMYRARGWPVYGGGANLAEARQAAIVERNGVRFAFLGCNPVGPDFAWARESSPGAAPCDDYGWMVTEIARLKAEGDLVIVTLQYYEYYSPEARLWQQADFRRLAEAGAVIVSGSQGHYSQVMEFDGPAFIHYGLGNLFFDQMGYTYPGSGKYTPHTRRGFIDRYVFYEGRLVGIELLTTMLEDYARPRPMTPEERAAFLEEYFNASGWPAPMPGD